MGAVLGSGRAVDPDRLAVHFRHGTDRLVNSLRLPGEIQVERAQDDASMILGPALMKAKEMTAVVRYLDAALRDRRPGRLRRGEDGAPDAPARSVRAQTRSGS